MMARFWAVLCVCTLCGGTVTATRPLTSEQSLEIAARVSAREGVMAVGLRNHLSTACTGHLRIVSAHGIELLGHTLSFALAPHQSMQTFLPVRHVRKDRPEITCLLVRDTGDTLHADERTIRCKSGARLRDIGGRTHTGALASYDSVKVSPLSGGVATLTLPRTRCTYAIRTTPAASWDTSDTMMALQGYVPDRSARCARVSFTRRCNDRGDELWVYMLTIVTQGWMSTPPSCVVSIPAEQVNGKIMVVKKKESWTAHRLNPLRPLPRVAGRDASEVCIVWPRDWCVFTCDAVWPEISWSEDDNARFLNITFRGRQSWAPPFELYRAHTVTLPVHLPVGISVP